MVELPWFFWRFDIAALIDVVIVAIILYWILTIVQGTRATQLIWGIVILLIISAVLSTRREFVALNFLIASAIPALLLFIPVVFQPELRRALEQLGHTGSLLNRSFTSGLSQGQMSHALDEISRAAGQLARQRYGGLIVIERDTGLQEYADRAIPIDALATRQLLITIFFPNTPLHDGAVIVRNERVIAAAAVLPLTEQELGGSLGTRHRAGVGISEESDAVAVVVSEETGQISVATGGRLVRNLSQERLRLLLLSLFHLDRDRQGPPEEPGGLKSQ
jgi:diadenylate cyclase